MVEGSPVAPFALLGTAGGFVLGFMSWNRLHLDAISAAPVVWLLHHLGDGGALALQLTLLGGRARCLAGCSAPSPSPGSGRG